MAKRLRGRFGYHKNKPFTVTFHPDKIPEPLDYPSGSIVLTCSMGDCFHPRVQDVWLEAALRVMLHRKDLQFLMLTKRPVRMAEWWARKNLAEARWIWPGISAEDQESLTERLPILSSIKTAASRWISLEPLLAPISLWRVTGAADLGLVVCGAETGPQARFMHPHWAGAVLSFCRAHKIPFLFKRDSNDGTSK